ncbi:sugar ABC transporter ATP-binding protein [Kaistia defluvii]|uniref:sugar ABC transporter ATP-binding protein n=1 Tax=Kaistia defluvii TaxID=410841 RepID=UPI00224F958A|nr:sugar ABC transporter ATP-binding protein [Kaistia defluvii]MCX5517457.1 sugar ABC transporter ATP-binding protein [Kaistia defluvii]
MTPFVAAESIAKAYGGVQALTDVSLMIAPGEVHGLVGANGAGKSTLIKILAGLVQPDAGRILVDGAPTSLPTPHHATDLGMSFIHQELAFIPGMTVLQNILLGVPKKTRFGMVDWQAAAREVAPIAERVGIKAPLSASVKGLSTAENWLINICRALVRNARLIVMDEPTASLSAAEAEKLFAIVEDLSASGVAVLYVSHRLDEIMRLCSRVSVFRDGRSVGCLEGAAITRPALIEAIVGSAVAPLAATQRHPVAGRKITLTVDALTRAPKVNGVSFELRQGEVLGIGGLVGAGRTELARLIYGADRADSGVMTLDGASFSPSNPTEAVKAGLGLVPEERRSEGLLLTKSVAFNLQIANLANIVRSPVLPLIDRRKREALSLEIVRDLAVKTPSIDTPVGRLSGGNQQKVVIGRWLLRAPKVLILDEPTRGVDIGARGEIHRLVRELAARGMAVIVISSEPDELPDLCDRVLIMVEGRIVRALEGADITRNAIVEASYFVGEPPSRENTI